MRTTRILAVVSCFVLWNSAAELLAQSGARPAPSGSASRPSPRPTAGSSSGAFSNRVRSQTGAGLSTIDAFVRESRTSGTAQNEIRRSSFGFSSGLSPSQPQAPPRARAASFGTVNNRTQAKPFTGVQAAPTVSPFLGLFTESFDFDTVNFNTIVQPQLQQQQQVQSLQRQQRSVQLQQQAQARAEAATALRLQQLSARPAFNPSGSQRAPGTGHPTAFGQTFRYFGNGR